MALQLLAYLRLARVADPAQLASVSFERDSIVSQGNEYEVLQLLMGDIREGLSAYPSEPPKTRDRPNPESPASVLSFLQHIKWQELPCA